MKVRVLGLGAALGVCLLAGCGNQPITIGEDATAATNENVGTTGEQLVAAPKLVVSVEGAASATVSSILGGSVKAPVVTEGSVGPTGSSAGKHLGAVSYEPVTIPVMSGMPKTYFDWASNGLKGTFSTKSIDVQNCDFNSKEIYRRSFSESSLIGLGFPALDASSKASVPLFTEKFAPTLTQTKKGSGATCNPGPGTRLFMASNFRVELDGLDTSRVSKIDAFEVKRGVNDRRFAIPNLRLYVGDAGVDDFRDWFDSFVLKGKNDDQDELTGRIAMLGPDLKTELLALELNGVGISRLSDGDDEKEGSVADNTWVIDLYVEEMSLRVPQ